MQRCTGLAGKPASGDQIFIGPRSDTIVAGAEIHLVVAFEDDNRVRAATAKNRIIAKAAVDPVPASIHATIKITIDKITIRRIATIIDRPTGMDRVTAAATQNQVAAAAAIDSVIAVAHQHK